MTPRGSPGGERGRGNLHGRAPNVTFLLRDQSADRPGPLMNECPHDDRPPLVSREPPQTLTSPDLLPPRGPPRDRRTQPRRPATSHWPGSPVLRDSLTPAASPAAAVMLWNIRCQSATIAWANTAQGAHSSGRLSEAVCRMNRPRGNSWRNGFARD
jgi:hypothetical protein